MVRTRKVGFQEVIGQVGQPRRSIHQVARDDMDDLVVHLHGAANLHQPRAHDDLAIFAKRVGPDDEIDNAALVFQRDEHDALGAARSLADENDACDRQMLVELA